MDMSSLTMVMMIVKIVTMIVWWRWWLSFIHYGNGNDNDESNSTKDDDDNDVDYVQLCRIWMDISLPIITLSLSWPTSFVPDESPQFVSYKLPEKSCLFTATHRFHSRSFHHCGAALEYFRRFSTKLGEKPPRLAIINLCLAFSCLAWILHFEWKAYYLHFPQV